MDMSGSDSNGHSSLTVDTTNSASRPEPSPSRDDLEHAIASLLAVLSCMRPRGLTQQDYNDFSAPLSISVKRRIALREFMDAVASICVREVGEVHAVALYRDNAPEKADLFFLLHGSNDAAIWEDPSSSSEGKDYLRSAWAAIADVAKGASVDKLACVVYRWCSPALFALFGELMEDISNGLRKFFAENPEPVAACIRFSTPVRSAFVPRDYKLLEDMYEHFIAARSIVTSTAPTDADFLALHHHLDFILSSLMIRHCNPLYALKCILGIYTGIYFEQITWLAKAIREICQTVPLLFHPAEFGPMDVVHAENMSRPFSANIHHPDVMEYAHYGLRSFEKCLLAPILKRHSATEIKRPSTTHCECTLLSFIDSSDVKVIGYIGLSQPSCVACDQTFAHYNIIGRQKNLDNMASNATGLSGTANKLRDNVPTWQRWRGIRTRPTNVRVSVPWITPPLSVDADCTLSATLRQTLKQSFRRAWCLI